MAVLALQRTSVRHRYELAGHGTVTCRTASLNATFEVGDRRFTARRRGVFSTKVDLAGDTGAAVGDFIPHGIVRPAALHLSGQTLEWRRQRHRHFSLLDGGRVVATFDARGRRRTPVLVTYADGSTDSVLLLIGCWLAKASVERARRQAQVAATGG